MALTAGVEASVGSDAVICLDADLQHPPEVIPELVAKWEEGYDIVRTFLDTDFPGEARHQRRIDLISEYENR